MVSVRPSVGQDPDLDQVVGQDRLPGPDACSVQAIEAGAGPAGSPLEAADPALAAGAPLDRLAEGRSVFGGLSGPAGLPLRGMTTVRIPARVGRFRRGPRRSRGRR